MPKPRKQENQDLPDRWRFKHGRYYYRVPPGMEAYWDFKQDFPLGKTIEESAKAYYGKLLDLAKSDDLMTSMINEEDIASYKQPNTGSFIYFLFNEDEIVYVGKTSTAAKRIRSHWKDKTFTHHAMISCSKDDRDRLEALYIGRHKPRYNTLLLDPVWT